MKRSLLIFLPMLMATAWAEEAANLRTPAELTAESGYVVLAQLEVYDYEKRRGIPVEGESWFDVLVPYKVPKPTDRLKVVEEGFGDDKCYFDDAELWNELPRYLLFLIEDEEGDVRGHPDGCSLPVLITTDNRYVVRWPQETMDLGEEAQAMIGEFEFQGPGAFVDLSEMTSIRRQETIKNYHLAESEDGTYRYTRGIPLEDFRKLLGEENLTRDRIQRGR